MQVRTKILVGLLMGALATVLSIAGAGAATTAHATATSTSVKPLVGVFNPIRNVGNNLCLQPVIPAPNSAVVQEPCLAAGDPNASIQGWQAVTIGGRTGFLNQASGACLFAFVGAQDGAPMGLNVCRTVSNEEFDTSAPLPNVVQIESRIGFTDTGFCVDVPGASTTVGLQMQLFSCNGTLAQRWVVGFPA